MTPREALGRKLDLLSRGVRLGKGPGEAPPWLAPGVSVDLALEGGPLVRVGVRPGDRADAYLLRCGAEGCWSVSDGGWSAGSELLTRRGPSALGKVRGRFLVVPVGPGPADREAPAPHQVVEEIRSVFAAGRADFVRLLWEPGDGALEPLLATVREIRNHFDTFVQVATGPVPAEVALDLYAGGVDALAVEADPEHPAREGLLARAGAVFPAGTVTWHVPWDPSWVPRAAALFEGSLASQVIPVLDLAPLAAAGGHAPPPGTADAVAEVLGALHRAARADAPSLLWVQEEGDEVGPLEAAALAGEGLGLVGWVRELAGTRVGSAAARGLAHLRRQLRVRRVRQSFESAGL